MGILILILGLLSLGLIAYWVIADVRIYRSLKGLPTARDGMGMDLPEASVCVIVPAHNEERVIEALIASLRAQDHPDMRVVLCLDRCTDATPELARKAVGDDERFEIIEIDACPSDWAGKVHAVWTGVTRSRGARDADLLLFTDADTEFHASLVRASCALLRTRGLGMLSLWSDLSCEHWFEKLVQPACGTELMYQYPLLNANRRERRRAFANGQFILFERTAYEAIGGHASVNEAVLEDMALARRVAEAKIPAGVFLADGMLRVRMYASWEAFRTGWKRIYIDCAKFKVARLRKHAWRMRMTSVVMPLAAMLLLGLALGGGIEPIPWRRAAVIVAGAAITLWLANLIFIYRRGGFPARWAPLHPIGAWLCSRILLDAARDLARHEPVQWGGRAYRLMPR